MTLGAAQFTLRAGNFAVIRPLIRRCKLENGLTGRGELPPALIHRKEAPRHSSPRTVPPWRFETSAHPESIVVVGATAKELAMKTALVCGAGGFIGGHLVKRLKREGFWVRGVDLKYPEFAETAGRRFRHRRSARPALLPSGRRPPLRRGLPARRRHGRRRLHLHRRARRRHHAQLGDDQPQHARRLPASATSSASSIRRRPASIPSYNQHDPEQPELLRGQRLSGRPGQRVRLGEAVQRAALPRLQPQLRHDEPRRALPQHLRPRRHLDGRQGEGAGRALPQGRRGTQTAARSRSGATASRRARSSISTNASRAPCA